MARTDAPNRTWILLGLLGALLAFSSALVHVPATVWAGNVGEFHFRFGAFLGQALAVVAAGLAASAVLLWLVRGRVRIALACLMAAIALVARAHGTFAVGDLTALDGQNAPVGAVSEAGPWSVAISVGLCLLLAVAVGLMPRPATSMLLFLNLGLAVSTAVTVFGVRDRPTRPFEAELDQSLFSYSATRNVLVVIMDTLQADAVVQIFQDDPALEKAFDGFQFFTDTAAAAPTTFLSLPAIHSGDVYRNQDWLANYFTDSIRNQSFVTRFADAGYTTTLVNPIEGICPERTAICTSAERILRPADEQFTLDAYRLLDVSLFRMSPAWLKPRIYDNGRWLFGGRLEIRNRVFAAEVNGHFAVDNQLLDGMRLFREMADRVDARAEAPTFKLVHSFVPHPPYALGSNCRPSGRDTVRNVVPQSRCALLALVALLQRLEKAGVYDNTVVLVFADHGVNPGMGYLGLLPEGEPQPEVMPEREWQVVAGLAHPAFLLKPLGGRGPLAVVRAPVHVTDVGATLCAATGDCQTPLGIPAGQAPADRPRTFVYYTWEHEYWSRRNIPNLIPYEIRGPVQRPDSWVPVAEGREYRPHTQD